jgi:hypothetical protein
MILIFWYYNVIVLIQCYSIILILWYYHIIIKFVSLDLQRWNRPGVPKRLQPNSSARHIQTKEPRNVILHCVAKVLGVNQDTKADLHLIGMLMSQIHSGYVKVLRIYYCREAGFRKRTKHKQMLRVYWLNFIRLCIQSSFLHPCHKTSLQPHRINAVMLQ